MEGNISSEKSNTDSQEYSDFPSQMMKDQPEESEYLHEGLSPAPMPSEGIIMGEPMPDIDMKIRESEFKMKGEIIRLNNRIDKLVTHINSCCPSFDEYEKHAKTIQSRFRGNKDRTSVMSEHPDFLIQNKHKITKIEVMSGDLIDSITFHFKDGSKKKYGGNGGSKNHPDLILEVGEKITSVHYYPYVRRQPSSECSFLGNGFIFHTNLGREYKVLGNLFKTDVATYEFVKAQIFDVKPDEYLIGLEFNLGGKRNRICKMKNIITSSMLKQAQKKFDYKTKGWTIFKNTDSFPHHNKPGTDEINIPYNKEKTIVNEYCGFTLIPLGSRRGIVYYRNYDIDVCLNNVLEVPSREYQKINSRFNGPCDFYLAPGASLKLIKEKMNEGFTIEFEDENDKREVEAMQGGGYRRRNTRRKSRKNNTRRKSRKKKTRRKTRKRKKKIK